MVTVTTALQVPSVSLPYPGTKYQPGRYPGTATVPVPGYRGRGPLLARLGTKVSSHTTLDINKIGVKYESDETSR